MSKKMLGNLMKQAQEMQAKMARIQEEAASKTIEASAGGGMVKVTANGRMEILAVRIEKEVVNPEDVEMLQDLIVAATNEAIKQAQEIVESDMGKLTAGMGIPGMGGGIPGLF